MGFRSGRAALFALLALSATAANAQVIHYVSSGTINYDVRGRDILFDPPASFISYLTLTEGGLISCNMDASDGLEGVEIFNANELHIDGGAIAGEGGRKGGVRLHDVASIIMTGGTVNSVRGRDGTTIAQNGGVVGEMSLQDRSFAYLNGGSLSLISLYGNAVLEVRGGRLGGVRLLGGSARFYGSGFRVFGARNAALGGFRGTSYFLTGVLSDGERLSTQIFLGGATAARPTGSGLLFNAAPIAVQAAAPEPASAAFLLFGLIVLIARRLVTRCGVAGRGTRQREAPSRRREPALPVRRRGNRRLER